MQTTTPHLVQINVSKGGVPKHPIPRGIVTRDRILGDDWNDKRHHGLPDQALCLFSLENIEGLVREGFALFPGALGENLTTRGLEYRRVQPGQLYRIGQEVIIRITKVRQPCRTIAVYGASLLRALYDAEVKRGNMESPRWGRSGFYAEVLREGTIVPGDPLSCITDASASSP
jgi:MOSC domain-containing protein YiiM